MKIYLSIPKGLSTVVRSKVVKALESHDVNWYKGGDYSNRIVTGADTTILLLAAEEVTKVGRGQYTEGNLAALEEQKPKCVWYNPITGMLHLYEIEDMQKLGDATWQRYASLNTTELAVYTPVELNDYYNNFENT